MASGNKTSNFQKGTVYCRSGLDVRNRGTRKGRTQEEKIHAPGPERLVNFWWKRARCHEAIMRAFKSHFPRKSKIA